MRINVKKTDTLVVPVTATPDSSGYDVVALDVPEIVGKREGDLWTSIDYIQYKTGLFIAPQSDNVSSHKYHTFVMPRSSLSKYNLVLCNSVALIDNDYRGEILLRFRYIWQPEDFVVDLTTGKIAGRLNVVKIYKKGDAIGQVVAEVSNRIDWVVVADLSETVRGAGGFGSSTPDQQKRVEAPKEAASLINKWQKEVNIGPQPSSYETLIREREKSVIK